MLWLEPLHLIATSAPSSLKTLEVAIADFVVYAPYLLDSRYILGH